MNFLIVSYFYRNLFQKDHTIHDENSQIHMFRFNIINLLQLSIKIVPYYRNSFQNSHEICNENSQKDIFQFFLHLIVELKNFKPMLLILSKIGFQWFVTLIETHFRKAPKCAIKIDENTMFESFTHQLVEL